MNKPSRRHTLRTVPFDAAEYLADDECVLTLRRP